MPDLAPYIPYIALTLIAVNAIGLPLLFLLGRRGAAKEGARLVREAKAAHASSEPKPGGFVEAGIAQGQAQAAEDTRLCGDCTYWDLEEGQSVMKQHPDFQLAAEYLPPAIIGAVIEYEPCPDCPAGIDPPDLPPGPDTEAFKGCKTCRGSGLKRKGPKPTGMPMKASWKDFGACLCEKTFDDNGDGGIVWKDDTCEYWRAKTHLKVVASS
jgi:hypothetical protein